jgi:hypothetical protein
MSLTIHFPPAHGVELTGTFMVAHGKCDNATHVFGVMIKRGDEHLRNVCGRSIVVKQSRCTVEAQQIAKTFWTLEFANLDPKSLYTLYVIQKRPRLNGSELLQACCNIRTGPLRDQCQDAIDSLLPATGATILRVVPVTGYSNQDDIKQITLVNNDDGSQTVDGTILVEPSSNGVGYWCGRVVVPPTFSPSDRPHPGNNLYTLTVDDGSGPATSNNLHFVP